MSLDGSRILQAQEPTVSGPTSARDWRGAHRSVPCSAELPDVNCWPYCVPLLEKLWHCRCASSRAPVLHRAIQIGITWPSLGNKSYTCFWISKACRYSIHGPADAKEQRAAEESFPRLIPGTENCYHCGFHDGKRKCSFMAYCTPLHTPCDDKEHVQNGLWRCDSNLVCMMPIYRSGQAGRQSMRSTGISWSEVDVASLVRAPARTTTQLVWQPSPTS